MQTNTSYQGLLLLGSRSRGIVVSDQSFPPQEVELHHVTCTLQNDTHVRDIRGEPCWSLLVKIMQVAHQVSQGYKHADDTDIQGKMTHH